MSIFFSSASFFVSSIDRYSRVEIAPVQLTGFFYRALLACKNVRFAAVFSSQASDFYILVGTYKFNANTHTSKLARN